MKKIFYICVAFTILFYNNISKALLQATTIDPNGKTILNPVDEDLPAWLAWRARGTDAILVYVNFFKELLFNVLWIVVVGAFIYVWYKFVTARGNPEEFKKAWTHTIYIVVGIALISAAWWIVSLVSGLDF